MIAFSGSWFRRPGALKKAVAQAHGRLVREALMPVHYETRGVPDTFEGRAQMVTAMTALACARFAEVGGPLAAELTERLNARVLDGFDAAFREKGVGDHSIARKVRTLAEAHSGLGRALVEALREDDSDEVLAAVLQRNGVTAADTAGALAAALRRYQALFAGQSDTEILSGGFACGGSAPAV
ncbi:ubiquinol-cytochrome C chaperone family protein [Hyphomonas sp. NPDC076900]|uniref:ubiquinol-cytochrome C chaperone family protein n=1 Tax=unclassified Hyphomonas TaxID=2630699 RepID=UPI003CFDD596